MGGHIRHHVLIAAVAAALFFVNLGGPRLWDRDEPRNAGCAVEMLERGDWVVPWFNGTVRDHKPVLLYWLMMAAYGLFGVSEFAARFWSAALGVGTALATYQIGRRLFNAQVGLWGAIILTTSLMFGVAARAATPDSALIFFSTMALLVFVLGTFRRNDAVGHAPADSNHERAGGSCLAGRVAEPNCAGRFFPVSWRVAVLMYGIMGVAVLAKGPVGLVLPTAVIGMFLLIMRLPGAEAVKKLGQAPLAKRSSPALPDVGREPVPFIRSLDDERIESDWQQPALRLRLGSVVLTEFWIAVCVALMKISLELGVLAFAVLGIHLLVKPLPILRPFAPVHFLRTCWFMRPVTAVVAVLAVALPWHVWVGVREYAWIEGFFLQHNLGRAAGVMEGHGGSALFYYPMAVMAGFFPWSVFFAPMLIGLVGRIRRRDSWSPVMSSSPAGLACTWDSFPLPARSCPAT